jgi:uncharacterized protein (DUF1015 family)
VYDALNVLIAAGLIQKNAKSVKYISNPTYKLEKKKGEENGELVGEVRKMSEGIERKKKVIEELKLKKQSLNYLLNRNKQL